MKLIKIGLSIIIAFVLFINTTNACTVIVAGKDATTDGSVIISHTDAGDDCRIRVVPAKDHKPGEKANVYWGIQEIQRPLRTNTSYLPIHT